MPGEYVVMNRKLSRKYAQCKRKFELGIWGHDLNLIKGVYLTTWSKAVQSQGKYAGRSKNEWRFMKQDLRELRRRLKKEGYLHESCFTPELTPINALLHLHGFMRFLERVSSAELHSVLSRLWGQIHDSPVVWVKDLYSVNGVMAYDLKDAVKNYASAEVFGGRVLCSKGWLPTGWRKVIKVMVRWYLENRYPDWVQTAHDIDVYVDKTGYEKVWMAKEILNDYIWRWCNGEDIRLEFSGGETIISGNLIFERSI